MHAQNFLVNDSSNGQAVEAVSESFPQFDVISSLALVVKSINTVDGGALVVSSQQKEVLRVFNFVSQQQANCFETLFASINVISQEEVVGIRGETSILE